MGIKKKLLRIKRSLTFRGICHILAMNMPHDRLSILFYRLRGAKIGHNVGLGAHVFMEESRPELITIEDNVHIGPNVMILTHDSSRHCINPEEPVKFGRVRIKRNSYIGAGAIILPGVTIGEYAIVGAGAVVTKDVPPRSVAVGVPARVIKRLVIPSSGEEK